MTTDPALTVYGAPVSTWTRTVCMLAVEKDLDWTLQFVPRDSDEHLALHPFGRYPAAEVGGRVLFETLPIVLFLDADGSLQPSDPDARARMHTWMGVCADYLFKDVVRGIPRDRACPPEQLATARAALEIAETMIGPGEFLAGDALSLADLYLAPQIANAAEKAPEVLDGLPEIERWMAGMRQRASFAATAYDPETLRLR